MDFRIAVGSTRALRYQDEVPTEAYRDCLSYSHHTWVELELNNMQLGEYGIFSIQKVWRTNEITKSWPNNSEMKEKTNMDRE